MKQKLIKMISYTYCTLGVLDNFYLGVVYWALSVGLIMLGVVCLLSDVVYCVWCAFCTMAHAQRVRAHGAISALAH